MNGLPGTDHVDFARAKNSYAKRPSSYALGDAEGNFFSVRVEQAPEKKGIFIKHVEYEVISPGNRVPRRYNDFVALHSHLMQYYSNRLIPRLPPKKAVGQDDAFIAKRKRALTRYMTLLAHNPVVGRSIILELFLNHRGNDVEMAMKNRFKPTEEEFPQVGPKEYEEIRTAEGTEKITQLKNHMTSMDNAVLKMRSTMETICTSAKDQVRNYMALNLDISNLCSGTGTPFENGGGSINVLNEHNVRVLGDVATEVATVTKQWLELSTAEESMVIEYVYAMKDLLKGWKDLLERQGKNFANEQKNVNKAATAKPKDQTQIEEKSGTWSSAENRMKFSLWCLQQETEFVQKIYPPLISLFLRHFGTAEAMHLQKMATAWDDITCIAECLPGPEQAKQPSAPPSY